MSPLKVSDVVLIDLIASPSDSGDEWVRLAWRPVALDEQVDYVIAGDDDREASG